MFENLTDDNFMIYAMKAYDTPNCVMSEFEEDLNRIPYLKRLITKYKNGGELKERLIINHLIIIYNVFGVEAANRILFYKLEESDYPVIKPFLIYLNYMPNIVRGINGSDILNSKIQMDKKVVECLRNLK
jgi:hypothetical protein